MTDGMGYTFAPTRDQSEMGQVRGGFEGIPQAVQVLGLRLPRVLGARPIAPTQLMNVPGGQGGDPYLSALAQSLAKLMGGLSQPGGVPPQQFRPPTPNIIPGVDTGAPGPSGYRPTATPTEQPTSGTAMPSPYRPTRPTTREQIGSKYDTPDMMSGGYRRPY